MDRHRGATATAPCPRLWSRRAGLWSRRAGLQVAGDDLDGQLHVDLGVQPTGTTWVPTDLIGSASWIFRRSMHGAGLGFDGLGHVGRRHRAEQAALGPGPGRHRDGGPTRTPATVCCASRSCMSRRSRATCRMAAACGLDASHWPPGRCRSGTGSSGRSPSPPRRCRPSCPRRRCHFASRTFITDHLPLRPPSGGLPTLLFRFRSRSSCSVSPRGRSTSSRRRLDRPSPRSPLVPGAVPRHPPGADLAPVAHVAAEHADVLVVDPLDLGLAQRTGLLLRPP